MGQLSASKMRGKAKEVKTPSNSTRATVNRAGGLAFEISDAALKLVCMTGGSFYAEPKFYSEVNPKRISGVSGSSSVMKKFEKLTKRLDIVNDKLEGFIGSNELDDVAKEVIATAIDVSRTDRPEDLLAIARWLRNDANIRLTPQVLLVLASRLESTKGFVRKYAPLIAVRPDEIKTCMLLHRYFFGMKSLSNGLANGLSDAVARFGEAALMKYDGNDYPTWRDVLQTLPRGKDKPLSKPLAGYFITGEVVDATATPIIAARKELSKMVDFNDRAKELAVASKVNWEVLISQFGNKTCVWEHLLSNNLVGYMALLRNLRNILEAKVSTDVINQVASKLVDPVEVVRSKQLPFRFLSAHLIISEILGDVNFVHRNQILGSIEKAADLAVKNVPVMPGLTVVFADNSGSMRRSVSEKSTVTCAMAANALCGIVAKCSESSIVCAFGTDIAPVAVSINDTVIGIANKVENADTKGHNTNAHLIPEWLKSNGLKPDRVIVLSDLQAWNDKSMSGICGQIARNSSESKALCDTWANYVSYSGGKNTWLHCVHLNGYGDSPVDSGAFLNQLSGFSEKVVSMLLRTEQGGVEENSLPTLDQIRKDWYL